MSMFRTGDQVTGRIGDLIHSGEIVAINEITDDYGVTFEYVVMGEGHETFVFTASQLFSKGE